VRHVLVQGARRLSRQATAAVSLTERQGGLASFPPCLTARDQPVHEEVVREVTVPSVWSTTRAASSTGLVRFAPGLATPGPRYLILRGGRHGSDAPLFTGAKGLGQLPNRPPGDFGQVRPASLEPSRLEPGIQPQRRGNRTKLMPRLC
jgi:hypothetical protein